MSSIVNLYIAEINQNDLFESKIYYFLYVYNVNQGSIPLSSKIVKILGVDEW